MVSKSTISSSVAQFVRDVLSGGIATVQNNGGVVIGFMGDAFLSILDDVESVYMTCAGIAKDLDRQCEYISNVQRKVPDAWNFSKGGFGIKIGIEYGWIDKSDINCNFLGTQKLFIGQPINYASRIFSGGEGNRCHAGPKAMKKGLNKWHNSGPYTLKGKGNEGEYQYWTICLGDIWKEGIIEDGEDTFWG